MVRSWRQMAIRTRYYRNRVTIEENGCILSELPRSPGPTHSVWDVMAAAVGVFAQGPRLAMLGFSGGGMVGAMRALGCDQEVAGVDLWREGFGLFESIAAEWCGLVRFYPEDAVTWLRRQRSPYDVIVEDLSVSKDGDTVKPGVSLSLLPDLMGRKITPEGVIISNLLPTPGFTWEALISSSRIGPGILIEFESYHNRVLIQGSGIGKARSSGRILRQHMHILGSALAQDIRVRTL